MNKIKEEIRDLSEKLLYHQSLYYIKSAPIISDIEYDALFDRLLYLEKEYPQYAKEDSPTKRIGVDLDNQFAEKEHKIPVLSLDKEYTIEGINKWVQKNIDFAERQIGFVLEEKLDGASIVLYYERGILKEALTRGDGKKGNLVTANVKTIKNVPLKLTEPVTLSVRGEIFIKKDDFTKYNKKFENKYSNPRNLASGSLRQLKSSLVAEVPLKMVAYEGYFEAETIEKNTELTEHIYNLIKLDKLGFEVSNKPVYISDNKETVKVLKSASNLIEVGRIEDIKTFIEKRVNSRDKLQYDIDGLVIKINDLDIRESLGYTSHHPRWAIAYKFESPMAETILLNIVIQIGRNGRVTPVAELEPVHIAGSIVSRATLHNLEYIELLELGIGDIIAISKRGEIIPAVEEVIEQNPKGFIKFNFPELCPFCSSIFIKEGAHHFCKNKNCPERIKRSIIYFASKDQMDIDSLGEKTINFLYENNYINNIADLYSIDYENLLNEEGFKEKKIQNIKSSIEKSKDKPFSIVLSALGFDGIGKNRASDLIKEGLNSIDKIIEIAEKGETELLINIGGVGDILADSIISQFTDKDILNQIEKLKAIGLNFEDLSKPMSKSSVFEGQIWVITGTFENFKPRSVAADEIKNRSGKVTTSVNSKTTHLLKGESAGSKLKKAEELNKIIIDEDEFMEMIKNDKEN